MKEQLQYTFQCVYDIKNQQSVENSCSSTSDIARICGRSRSNDNKTSERTLHRRSKELRDTYSQKIIIKCPKKGNLMTKIFSLMMMI